MASKNFKFRVFTTEIRNSELSETTESADFNSESEALEFADFAVESGCIVAVWQGKREGKREGAKCIRVS